MAAHGGSRVRKTAAERIATINEKIAKQNELIKACEERIQALEAEKQQILDEEREKQMSELVNLLNERNISIDELRSILDKHTDENAQ